MRIHAFAVASAVLIVAALGCGSSAPPPKTSTDLPADSHDSVGGGSPDNLNSTSTSQGNAPKEEQKNDQATETKSDPKKP